MATDGPFKDFEMSEDEWYAFHLASWLHDCEYALSYGYETERDVMGLVDFLWRLPSDFRKDPQYGWVEEILSDKDSDAELKTESLQNAYALFTAAAEQGEADHVGT